MSTRHTPKGPATSGAADSDEVARAFRDNVARCLDIRRPGFGASLADNIFHSAVGSVNPWISQCRLWAFLASGVLRAAVPGQLPPCHLPGGHGSSGRVFFTMVPKRDRVRQVSEAHGGHPSHDFPRSASVGRALFLRQGPTSINPNWTSPEERTGVEPARTATEAAKMTIPASGMSPSSPRGGDC
jgi:hypothetical protein